ncbi:MAG: SDR family NAD(P)-dependent oxidoreductase [Cytophagales bacterium]|nr:SDR family NAD(P)-dependent oxidoreductase [Cytophagales bacterium]MCA6366782.1 SDR family NAD(P)-dependent oxidoreductase [Cytophagales bacterium]MCA6370840.1 SDR family NAD(P)-dependent oxidoreductase [Cytophagales bacterium]MCA6375750.1 SDR family NAD(P)-dependent oxidoreductase [Cytophagales bacterium]MCA6384700.1 SDR family NAD(P)-dependent oxidoreductase [Cytophagales bacterium]
MKNKVQHISDTDIAIIGMSGRFPGANSISEFWENLKHGVISIKRYSDEELIENEVNILDLENPNYVRAKGTIEDVEYFDASFFDYSSREAEILDPQTRLLTELAWHALEDAGYVPDKCKDAIGVYVGITNNLYWQLKMIASGKITDNETLGVAIYSEKDHVSTRISYKLNLTGPSFTVETQCSTSLVSFHLACQGILNGECEMAITGGASINFPNKAGYIYQEGSIHSKDGICRSFDDKANGTVFSDGAGLVVIKNAKKAIVDGDNIYAIVKGSAINNDGQDKAGYTAPSVTGQKEVITKAYRKAGINPETVTYVETHGTGTAIGDPIEVEALTQAFNTTKRGFCRIGSVKPNIGHLDNAAGIANVIKVTLAIKNKLIPPSVNYNTPNSKIKFEETPFVVNDLLSEWKENNEHPRRAGVSSYGVGGTNAHVILEEYLPENSLTQNTNVLQLIPLSARTERSFQSVASNIVSFLNNKNEVSNADLAHTMQNGRKDFQYRGFILSRSIQETIEKLQTVQTPSVAEKPGDIKTIFLFPGQGAQYIDMGLELYRECKPFRDLLDECFSIYQEITKVSLRDIVFSESHDANALINQTKYVQPLLFSYEYALATLLKAAGVKPDYMIGHSIGEYTAACISGVFSLKDAMKLVTKRGALMQSLPKGSMMALMMDPEALPKILPKDISIAAVNATNMCVVSGTTEAIDAFEQTLNQQKIEGRRLHTSHAFHSHMMQPILDEFERAFKEIPINDPQTPYLSNLTGSWIQSDEIKKPSYWSAHLRNTVLFKDGLEKLVEIKNAIVIEVGPGNTLGTFFKRLSADARNKTSYNTLRHPQEKSSEVETFYTLLGKLWQKGLPINWSNLVGSTNSKRISLPAYVYERSKHWVKGNVYQMAQGVDAASTNQRLTEKLHNRWIYRPAWVETLPKNVFTEGSREKAWLVFSDDSAFANSFITHASINLSGKCVVLNGRAFNKEAHRYVLDASSKGDYKLLFEDLKREIGDKEINIIHFWSLNSNNSSDLSTQKVKEIQTKGLMSILYLVQSVSTVLPKNKINIKIVSNNIHNVMYKDLLNPLNATLLGAVTTVPIEYKNISVCSIDLDNRHLSNPSSCQDVLQSLIVHDTTENIIALRDDKLYMRTFETVPFKHDDKLTAIIKDNGVYLITGGLGGIGIELATYLSKIRNVRLALIGRSDFADRSKWNQLMKSGGDMAEKIRAIQEIEKNGSQVLVLKGNVGDKESMLSCIDKINHEFGTVNGVLHCAGVAGGNIIQTLEPENIYDTMGSKIFGTLVLDEILNLSNLDFTVLCSSISSITGTFGQLSYTASNSFLDAFTHFRNSQGNKNVICFNWDIWQEVGMATKAMRELNREDNFKISAENIIEHPLFAGVTHKDRERVYISHLNPALHWMLNEHRILKQPVLPGVTYIEILGLIASRELQSQRFKIKNLSFYAPLTVDENTEKSLYSIIREESGAYNFSIQERYGDKKEGVCVKGQFQYADELSTISIDVNELIARCKVKTINDAAKEINKDTAFLELGQRWRCLKTIHLGETEGVAVIEMPDEFVDDFVDYRSHPAMLDIAFNYFAAWKIGQSEYLPFSYKNLNVYKPVPKKLYSHIQQNEAIDQLKETLSFKVNLIDEAGELVISIDEYTLKKVYSERVKSDNKFNSAIPGQKQKDSKDELIQQGIKSEEGAKIFDVVVSNFLMTGSSDYAQMIVSNNNLNTILKQEDGDAYSYFKTSEASEDQPMTDRPELSTLYEDPVTDVQKKVCGFFQTYLRINRLGIQDNFFELGVSSLDVVEIKIGIEESFSIELPVAVIFENPSVKALSKYIANELGEQLEEELVTTDGVERSVKIQEGRELLQRRLQGRTMN